ncbi:unnamed protein product [Caenorhabditis sp. 36 PRJEB53466]|nr:unnamed protein product [Caenorhabditis sp. 36 PRJEB53466]
MVMPVFLRCAQYFGFVSTEISTSLLLWLILTKASSRFGDYKWLMLSYAIYSIIYGFVEIAAQPIMHVDGACMFMYADSFLKHNKTLGHQLTSIYCASFGLCVSLLATHFLYRFVAVCRPNDLHRFEGVKLLKLYILPTFASVLWYLVCASLGPTQLKSEYMRDVIWENYRENTSEVGYMAVLYYYTDNLGNLVIHWWDLLCVLLVFCIMGSCIMTMLTCGCKTFHKMDSVGSLSKKTRELNRQLFRTLVLQTLVPFCTMFAPVGSLLIVPMFSIKIGKAANMPSMYASLYPALDASIAILMIRDFRETVLCRRRFGRRKNTVNTTTESTSHMPE